MAKSFEFIYSIEPPGYFGLPEQDKAVVPIGTKHQMPQLDPRTNQLVTHGQLSIFREDPTEIVLDIADASVDFHDNRLRVVLEGSSDEEAMSKANNLARDICILLAGQYGEHFHAKPLQAVRLDDETQIPKSRMQSLLTVRPYDLEGLKSSINRLSGLLEIADERLRKACAYFSHAAYLENEVPTPLGATPYFDDTPYGFHSRLVAAEVILHYYKSCISIVGEPGTDKDFQSRYRTIGISEEVFDRLMALKKWRDDYDVAHYELEWRRLEELWGHTDEAHRIAHVVIIEYSEFLLSQSAS